MKKILLFTVTCLLVAIGWAQPENNQEATVSLDLLRSPSSPGANLLGFATSDIQKPTDRTAFMASLQSASSGFTKLPGNFAVEISPFWLTRHKGFTIADMDKGGFSKIFRQTFLLSAAIRNADSGDARFNPLSTYTGFGFQFSIRRGRFDDKTKTDLDSIQKLQVLVTLAVDSIKRNLLKNNSYYQGLITEQNTIIENLNGDAPNNTRFKELADTITIISRETLDTAQNLKNEYKASLASLKQLAAEFKIERIGFFMDFAGGSSLEFRNKTFNNSKVYNAGAWLTFGTNTKKGLSILGIMRYLYNPEQVFADPGNILKKDNYSTIDGGARLAFSGDKKRFLFSAEALYRSVLNKNTIDPSWRLALNAEYDIGKKNQKLTFVFGRNFDGTITKDGNLMAALNLIAGFGSNR